MTTERYERLVIEPSRALRGKVTDVVAPLPPKAAARAWLVAATLTAVLVGLSGAARAAAPADAAVLSGRVADAAGPLSGARVVARDTADDRAVSTSTAVDGTFEFRLPAGVYQLEARLDGLRFPAETGVRLAPGDRRQIAIEGEPYYASGALAVPLGRLDILARELDDGHGDLKLAPRRGARGDPPDLSAAGAGAGRGQRRPGRCRRPGEKCRSRGGGSREEAAAAVPSGARGPALKCRVSGSTVSSGNRRVSKTVHGRRMAAEKSGIETGAPGV